MQFINGIWQTGSGAEFTSSNPANGAILWTGHEANQADVNAAIQSARQALPGWKQRSVSDRAAFLHAFQSQLQRHQDELAGWISQETGKPVWDAKSEVQAMIGKIPATLHALQERRSPTSIDSPPGTGHVRYQPHGVMAVFGPFNFPGHIANGQIVPALAAGNTVVLKPSEQTPLVAEKTVQLWEEAGLPKGVLNLVQGGPATGTALSSHSGINGVLFTGSLKTGIAIRKALVERPNVLLALELGGNNPLVIHEPEDQRAAVYGAIQSAFLTSGQRCTCARRLIITDSTSNHEFLDQFVTAVQNLRIDLPDASPAPFLGPLINAHAVDTVLAMEGRLLAQGGRALLSAMRHELGPAFVTPGIIDVTDCSTPIDEEVFGPLLQVIRVPDLEAAIDVANRTQYGLAASLFTADRADFEAFAKSVQAGLINWNRPTTGASALLPFGGVGMSGNHRPAGSFMIDSCNIPIATLESSSLLLPETLSPGVTLP